MINPLSWPRPHLIAWLVSLIVGAVLGVAFGYATAKTGQFVYTLDYWFDQSNGPAWALMGAIAVGGSVYVIKLLMSREQ